MIEFESNIELTEDLLGGLPFHELEGDLYLGALVSIPEGVYVDPEYLQQVWSHEHHEFVPMAPAWLIASLTRQTDVIIQ